MKEMVDKILNGETVDIADKGSFYLSVRKYRDRNAFQVGLSTPSAIEERSQVLDVGNIRKAGTALIDLAYELESRAKFKNGDKCFSVKTDGRILDWSFDENDSGFLARLYMGNAFKTRAEAEEHKEEIMAKFKELKDKGLV